MKHNCEYCGKEHDVKPSDLARGQGKTCSKSCAGHLREKSKPDYNPERVAKNNERRKHWNDQLIGTADNYYVQDDYHPFSSEALGQW